MPPLKEAADFRDTFYRRRDGGGWIDTKRGNDDG
jgi:hypothetical protein